MGRAFDAITEPMRALIERSPVFFVATAASQGGRVNLSPKGYDTFRVLDEHRVAYLDLTGSGAETIAHLRHDGRITFLFCSFDATPSIVRLYGTGRVLLPGDEGFDALRAGWGERHGVRSIIEAAIDRTSTSCGYAVPHMELVGERARLDEWAAAKTEDELDEYQRTRNATSIDGLPALDRP